MAGENTGVTKCSFPNCIGLPRPLLEACKHGCNGANFVHHMCQIEYECSNGLEGGLPMGKRCFACNVDLIEKIKRCDEKNSGEKNKGVGDNVAEEDKRDEGKCGGDNVTEEGNREDENSDWVTAAEESNSEGGNRARDTTEEHGHVDEGNNTRANCAKDITTEERGHVDDGNVTRENFVRDTTTEERGHVEEGNRKRAPSMDSIGNLSTIDEDNPNRTTEPNTLRGWRNTEDRS